MLPKSLMHTLIQLVEERLRGLSLVTAADRRYLRELTLCREELLRDLPAEDQSVVDARTTGARLGLDSPS